MCDKDRATLLRIINLVRFILDELMRKMKLEYIGGFRAAAVEAGIRKQGRLDLGLIVCDHPAAAAGVFTTNRVKAAPVLLDMERLQDGRSQAILVNSGIANACTGAEGMGIARTAAREAADALGIAEDLVLVASTGVIGEQLDAAKFGQFLPNLAAKLAPDGFAEVARAMMTTDTVPKTTSRTTVIDGRKIGLLGLAKGSGMIMPNMATMLSFVVTDAAVAPAFLRKALREAVEHSFNSVTVDGDTSTNDSVLILASGQAGNPEIAGGEAGSAFQTALTELLKELALMIAADGEGATKLATIRVNGARSKEEAKAAARTVANSNLVKTAFFGEDANWGRIIAALGRSGAEFDPERVDIAFEDVFLVKAGLGQGPEIEAQATEVLRRKEFAVNIDLHAGSAAAEYYTCDLSLDYVRINADYRS
jgi:glutamate N-acetyltransferase/amino-acid N-acetyltransferase